MVYSVLFNNVIEASYFILENIKQKFLCLAILLSFSPYHSSSTQSSSIPIGKGKNF